MKYNAGPLVFLLAAIGCAGCSHRVASIESQTMTAANAAATEQSVRAFAQAVAHDITQEGPSAWRRHFADSPAFFMASEGHLAFPNSASATAGIRDFAGTIKQMELRWGDDLRVDPLTPDLAVVAASWREVRVGTDGRRVEEAGFFTGTAEHRDGRWQFRNAHWSVAAPPPPVR
jgi:hypothetical protein